MCSLCTRLDTHLRHYIHNIESAYESQSKVDSTICKADMKSTIQGGLIQLSSAGQIQVSLQPHHTVWSMESIVSGIA